MMPLRVADGVEVFEVDPRTERERWLELRRGGITASEVSVLFGHPAYDNTLAKVMRRKLRVTPDRPNSYMQAGRYQEYAIAARLRAEHPDWHVRDPQVFLRDSDSGLGVTLDRDAVCDDWYRVVELKSVDFKRFDAWAKRAPIHARMQALVGAMLTDADGAMVVAEQRSGFGIGKQVIHVVERHPALEHAIREKAREFKARIEELKSR